MISTPKFQEKEKEMKKIVFLVLAFAFLCGAGLTSPVWAAYSAHQNDTDITNFLAVYPSAKSTKLDDCALCHPGVRSPPQVGKLTLMEAVIIATIPMGL